MVYHEPPQGKSEEEQSLETAKARLNKKPSGSPTRSGLLTPKRGALPTPKTEIERAKPYTTGIDQATDYPSTEPISPANTDKKNDSDKT